MTRELLERALQLLGVFSAFTVASGYLIINLFLGNYMVNDYSLINARAFQAGVSYIILVGGSVAATFAFLETRHCEKVSILQMFINFGAKPIILTNFFFTFFEVDGPLTESYSICLIPLSGQMLHALMTLSFVGFTMRLAGYIYIKQPQDKLGKLYDRPSLLFMGLSLLAFPIMILNNDTYRSIFMFFSAISFVCCMYFCIMVETANGLKTATKVEPSLFTADNEIQPPSKLEHLWIIVYVVITFLGNAGLYSWSVYPNLAEKYGGGRPLPIIITTNGGEQIEEKLIHRDTSRYYILEKDDRTIRLVGAVNIHTIKKE